MSQMSANNRSLTQYFAIKHQYHPTHYYHDHYHYHPPTYHHLHQPYHRHMMFLYMVVDVNYHI